MTNITAYIILIVAVILGTASNGFAKGAQGFTILIPSVFIISLLILLIVSPDIGSFIVKQNDSCFLKTS